MWNFLVWWEVTFLKDIEYFKNNLSIPIENYLSPKETKALFKKKNDGTLSLLFRQEIHLINLMNIWKNVLLNKLTDYLFILLYEKKRNEIL